MNFGLIIIGDEILSGNRQDKHFAFFKSALQSRGLELAWVQYLPDERHLLTQKLQQSFAEGLPTFVTGGIGGTPDDHTRQAAAAALGLPLAIHPEAAKNIEALTLKRGESLASAEHHTRLNMATFPEGCTLIPNPYNNIAGFSIRRHYFLPGFPEMAHPMAEWVLDGEYQTLQHQVQRCEKSIWLAGLPESAITPTLEAIETRYPGIRTSSLPTVREGAHQYQILFALKATGEACALLPQVWEEALATFRALGGTTFAVTESA